MALFLLRKFLSEFICRCHSVSKEHKFLTVLSASVSSLCKLICKSAVCMNVCVCVWVTECKPFHKNIEIVPRTEHSALLLLTSL